MGVHGCVEGCAARVPPLLRRSDTELHRFCRRLTIVAGLVIGRSLIWLFSALFNVHICRRSCRHYHPQQETLGLAGCHRGDVGRTGKKATGCLRRARFLASAAHVDGNTDADYVADEDDLLNSEAVNTQRSCTIGPHTHP